MNGQNPEPRGQRVLVHAPFGRDATLISGVLQQAGIEAFTCSSIESLCALVREGAGAVLVGDEALRPDAVQALERVIKEQPRWSDLPVFIMTSGRKEYQRRPSHLRLFESLGNVTFLARPLPGETIVSSFRMALRARAHQYQIRDHLEAQRRSADERQEFLAREQEARKLAELLNQVGPTLAAELDTQQLAQKVTDLATQLTGAQFGALFHNLRNEHGESYTLYTLSGAPREAFASFPMPRNTEVFGPTFRGEATVRSADITKDPRYGKNAPHRGMPRGHLPVRSYLAVPVMSRSGEVLGGLFFGHAHIGVFTEQHAQLAEGIAAQAAIALDNARLFSEVQRARDQLERSNAELRRANEDLNQFAYSASHDLKEPLRMIALYSQMLQRKYGPAFDEQAAQYLSYAVQGARQMELLIRDLLAYTQAVEASHENVSPVNASEVLTKAIENLKSAVEETAATIESEPLPVLLVREIHLLQLFQNLIGNALKYRSQASPHVHLSVHSQDRMWKICVADNGIGIDPQYADQVFGLFKRLHGGGSGYEGTGIGLAICQKIVQRYGGRIWVESEGDGRGSTFCFTLPGENGR